MKKLFNFSFVLILTIVLTIVGTTSLQAQGVRSTRNARSNGHNVQRSNTNGSYQSTHLPRAVSRGQYQTTESRAKRMADIRIKGEQNADRRIEERARAQAERNLRDGYIHNSSSSKSGSKSSSKGCSRCINGVNKQAITHMGKTNWLAYHNNEGQRCPYCTTENYTSHNHEKCSNCNIPQ